MFLYFLLKLAVSALNIQCVETSRIYALRFKAQRIMKNIIIYLIWKNVLFSYHNDYIPIKEYIGIISLDVFSYTKHDARVRLNSIL